MSLEVIKFVAGAGKTTESQKYMRNNENGIYLAFNNKVVDSLKSKGFLCKTIDSLFVSYIIPKMISLIPLISKGCKITYKSIDELSPNLLGVSRIKIDVDGSIYNNSSKTLFSLYMDNNELYKMNYTPNLIFIKFIFGKTNLILTDSIRNDLCTFLIANFSDKIIKLLESRFSFIIIDEAQDLSDFREAFSKLLANSNIKLIVLGDDNQNINGGGEWFHTLKPDKIMNHSYRCPEPNCKWIRENMGIEIYGENIEGAVIIISLENIKELDDGKRTLLYQLRSKSINNIVDDWKGNKYTIKSAKGLTIDTDIVIIGKTLNVKNMYTAVTRTTRKVYLTPKIKFKQ